MHPLFVGSNASTIRSQVINTKPTQRLGHSEGLGSRETRSSGNGGWVSTHLVQKTAQVKYWIISPNFRGEIINSLSCQVIQDHFFYTNLWDLSGSQVDRDRPCQTVFNDLLFGGLFEDESTLLNYRNVGLQPACWVFWFFVEHPQCRIYWNPFPRPCQKILRLVYKSWPVTFSRFGYVQPVKSY